MVDLAYILGASHSGTTLLAMLLGSHPDVCTVGELKATNLGDVDRYVCSCGRPIRACSFWRQVSEEMARRGFDFDIADAKTDFRGVAGRYARRLLKPLHRGAVGEWLRDAALGASPAWRATLEAVQRRNAVLAESVAAVTGKRVVVDSSKVGLRLKYLLRNRDLRVKVLHMVRDGRAVALTYMDPARFADAQDSARRGGGSCATQHPRLSMAEAAREWRRSNEEALNILGRLRESQFLTVRYEELCQKPGETLRGVFAFLGVEESWNVGSFRATEQHVIGNGMRLDSSDEIRLDDRWRSELTAESLQEFDRVAGAMSRRLGYS